MSTDKPTITIWAWKKHLKSIIRCVIPLFLRKYLAIWINQQKWLGDKRRRWWVQSIIQDFANKDINAYHKFLWKHHLSYAETYEIELRYGYNNFNESRKLFFAELPGHMQEAGIDPKQNISSIFEVGCSSGYLLRYMETDIFPSAKRIHGCDIDVYTINAGNCYLQKKGSSIELFHADMESIDRLLSEAQFDFILAAGVLLYLDQKSATDFVRLLLNHTQKMLAVTALASPHIDNAELKQSELRKSDHTWIHNVDAMIERAGGKVVARRWEGSKIVDGNSIYFLFAVPATDELPL